MLLENEYKVGDILKSLREEHSLTQDKLAEMLNIKRQTYSAWERNISNPDINTIIFLSQFYNVSTDYILGKTKIKNSIEPRTIAAHHDGEEWTEEELSEIEKFKEFVRMKRQQKK